MNKNKKKCINCFKEEDDRGKKEGENNTYKICEGYGPIKDNNENLCVSCSYGFF